MKLHDIKRKAISILAFVMTFATVFSSVAPLSAGAAYESLDFHDKSSDSKTVIPASELLSLMGIKNISDAELRCYEEAGIELSYTVPELNIPVSAVADDGIITVEAEEIEYTSFNGTKIVWTPKTSSLGTTEKEFVKSGNKYTVSYDGLSKGNVYTFGVNYCAVIMLTAEEASSIVSLPYEKGSAALASENAYNAEVNEYYENLKRFEKDSEVYASKLSEYREYVRASSEYTNRLSEYLDYKQKVADFEKATKAYEAYLSEVEDYGKKLEAYEANVKTYDERLKAYSEYIAYLAKLEAVRAKMKNINSVFERNEIDPSVYSTVMGNTVSEVVERKSELIAAGAAEKDVDNAGDATNALRKYLTEYSESGTEKEKLEYYKTNYILIKSNFLKLYNSLSALYETRLVRTALSEKGKLERFERFVADLGKISEIFRDTGATSPASSVWPDPVEEAEFPEEPVMPVFPSEVKPPVKTWTRVIEEPEKPEEIKEPVKPVLGDYVNSYPVYPVFTENESELMRGIKNGSITKRTVNTDIGITVGFSASVSAYIPDDGDTTEYFIVNFRNGNEICFTALVEKGTYAVYIGDTPSKASDEKYDYTFDCWTDKDGKNAELSLVECDTDYYASFVGVLRKYTVTFVSKDRTDRIECEYGSVPDPSGHYTKSYSENNAVFTFSGWNNELKPVTGNVTYTAVYTGKVNVYTVKFSVRGKEYAVSAEHGEYPVFDDIENEYEEDGKKYEFIGWSPDIVPASSDAVYTAVYREVEKESDHTTVFDSEYCTVITGSGTVSAGSDIGEAIDKELGFSAILGESEIVIEKDILPEIENADIFSVTDTGDGKFVFSVTDKNGNEIEIGEALLVLPFSSEKGSVNAYLNGEKCDCSYAGGKAYIKVNGTGNIEIRNSYTVRVVSSETGATELGMFSSEAGNVVVIPFASGIGNAVILSVKTTDGTDIEFSEDLSFVMPDDDVTVVMELSAKTYTIVFMNGNEEISSASYKYGETVSVPDPPVYDGPSPEDVKKHYVFIGWNPEVTPVIGDEVYTAIFVLEDIEEKYIPGKGFNFIFLGIAVILLIIAAAVFFVIRRIIKKKRRKTSKTTCKK